MEEQCLAFDHPHLSSTLRSIVDIYKKIDEIDKGLKFCREKLDDQKTRLGENHSCIARTLMIMGDVIMSNDLKESLQYYEEALSVTENCRPPDRQTAAECHQAMASIYGNLNMLDNALRCFFKALDLRRQTLSSDHLKIAEILMLMGCIYENMRNLSEALRYYNESLSIYRDNYGPEHEDVKKIEKKIARLNKLWQKDQE